MQATIEEVLRNKFNVDLTLIPEGYRSTVFKEENDLKVINKYNDIFKEINQIREKKKLPHLDFSVSSDETRWNSYYSYHYPYMMKLKTIINKPKNVDGIINKIIEKAPYFKKYYDDNIESSFELNSINAFNMIKPINENDKNIKLDIVPIVACIKKHWANKYTSDFIWLFNLIQKFFIGDYIDQENAITLDIDRLVSFKMKNNNESQLDFVDSKFLEQYDLSYDSGVFKNRNVNGFKNSIIYISDSQILTGNYITNLLTQITQTITNYNRNYYDFTKEREFLNLELLKELGV